MTETILAIDIGGTKTLAALMRGAKVLREVKVPTSREAGPDDWIASVARAVGGWDEPFAAVGVAVTGFVNDGLWSGLNPATLGVPQDYPLVATIEATFGRPAVAANDAQVAAWGEYRFGAGEREDLVFLTISTGVGGGIVVNGRPLLGLSGHFGQTLLASSGEEPFENRVSGRWMAAEAKRAGKDMEAPGVFAAARTGESWARAVIDASARRVALLCQDIQSMFDTPRIAIGGGIGLAEGYLDNVRSQLPAYRPRLAPNLVPARLGGHAGIVGVADLAASTLLER
ncbi:ROK family protein [Devosia sp. D6-9]|nr:ROK family protein [Devosia sp. D6-9]